MFKSLRRPFTPYPACLILPAVKMDSFPSTPHPVRDTRLVSGRFVAYYSATNIPESYFFARNDDRIPQKSDNHDWDNISFNVEIYA